MKTIEIEIDEQVYGRLKTHARPFEDTPNSVLRRMLGLEPQKGLSVGSKLVGAVRRANQGELLPEREYELPILEILAAAPKGAASARKVTQGVGERLRDRFTDLDKEKLPSGTDVRWENRVAFTRLRLVERGLLKKDSPRGTWEITDAGRELLRKSKKRG